MPRIIAVCPTCNETRYRSRIDVTDPKIQLKASDFEPLGDQHPGEDGKPVTCYKCAGFVKFGKEPEASIPAQPMSREEKMAQAQARAYQQPKTSNAIQTLFAANADETIIKFEEIAPMKYFIATSKRIIIVDANIIAQEM